MRIGIESSNSNTLEVAAAEMDATLYRLIMTPLIEWRGQREQSLLNNREVSHGVLLCGTGMASNRCTTNSQQTSPIGSDIPSTCY